jgi:hypothetical protein
LRILADTKQNVIAKTKNTTRNLLPLIILLLPTSSSSSIGFDVYMQYHKWTIIMVTAKLQQSLLLSRKAILTTDKRENQFSEQQA